MPLITSTGSASGMDFESIIIASLNAKKAQLDKHTTVKKEESNIKLSGYGTLKSALEDFQKSLDALTSGTGFNTHKVVTDQPDENPYFNVTTKGDAAKGSYDITVEQLASNETISQTFDKNSKFSAGTIEITVPGKKEGDKDQVIKIEVNDGDTIDSIRKKINDNDLGVSASVIKTEDGDRLVIDTGISGAQNDGKFSMSFTPKGDVKDGQVDSSTVFNYNSKNAAVDGKVDGWNKQAAQDAVITVDGAKITSSSNTFDNAISGLSITVNRVSEVRKDEDGNSYFVSNNVSVEQDIEAATKKVEDFVNAYNTLQDKLDKLSKNNSYTDGKNNYDGGALAGDSIVSKLQDSLDSLMSSMTSSSGGLDLYSIGLEVDSKGKWKLDSSKFEESLEKNFNAVQNLFANKDEGKEGLLVKLDKTIEEYTKNDGIIKAQEDRLNSEIKEYEKKEAQNADYLAKYEEGLRQKYSRLDIMIAKYNQSLQYLQSALI